MKCKKITALIATAVMALGLCMPASAAENVVSVDRGGNDAPYYIIQNVIGTESAKVTEDFDMTGNDNTAIYSGETVEIYQVEPGQVFYLNAVNAYYFCTAKVENGILYSTAAETTGIDLSDSNKDVTVSLAYDNEYDYPIKCYTGPIVLEEEGYYALTAYDFGPMAVFDVNTRVVHVMGEEEAPAAEQPAATTTKFVDVPADAYYAAPVAWAVENGVTGGTSATTFSPKQTCRSIEILTFLWNALEKPEPTAQENPFPNADTSAYYYKPILWAYQNGVITEAEAATFDPATYCDRGEMAIYLYRAAGSPATEAATFSDVPATGELNSAVSWALANGITAGTGEDTYSPDQTCPREQIITFLYRAYH